MDESHAGAIMVVFRVGQSIFVRYRSETQYLGPEYFLEVLFVRRLILQC